MAAGGGIMTARNIEIKASTASLADLAVHAASLASVPVAHIQQDDTFFAAPHARLKLRDFGNGTAELIAYKRDDKSGPRLSSYTRTPTSDPVGLRAVLAQVLPVIGRVRKSRQLFLIGQTRVHLDRVEGLGDFVELEVVLRDDQTLEQGQSIAEDLMRTLNIAPADLIARAYIDLLTDSTTSP
jgi:predicted adenylyl cyclase CyaB